MTAAFLARITAGGIAAAIGLHRSRHRLPEYPAAQAEELVRHEAT